MQIYLYNSNSEISPIFKDILIFKQIKKIKQQRFGEGKNRVILDIAIYFN